MAGIFLKIVNMSISACWIILAILLLRFILKKAPKWINCALWGIAGLRLVMPFSFESVMSLIPSTETISSDIMIDKTPTIDSGIPVINNIVNPVIGESFTPDPAASANPLQILIPVLAIAWIVGIAVLFTYTVVSYFRITSKIGTAVLLRDNIYQSENVVSPFVLGIIKPKIYLPFNMNAQDMEHVIAHEQAHIHRKDYLWKPLGFLILILHWFNPMVWLGYILLCRDIELACDEKVAKTLNDEQRVDYSQALLTCSVNRRMIAACPLAFGEVSVKDRVKSVLNYKKPAFWIIVVAIVVSIVTAFCFLTDPLDRGLGIEPESDNNKTTNSTSNHATTSDTTSTKTDTDTTQCAHVWGQWVEKSVATCQSSGKKERICHNCHAIESEKTETTDHKASDWIVDSVADVGKDGLKYTKCVYCNKRIEEKVIPAIDENHQHAVAEWVTIKTPTCTVSGTKNAICSCGKTIKTKEIPSNGHSLIIDKAVVATCTSNGLTEGSHCSVCNVIIVEQKTINSKGHTMTSKEVAATAGKEKHTLHYCTICSYSYEVFPTPTSAIKFKSNNNGTCSVIGLNDTTITDLVIPQKSPTGDTVTSIGNEAFKSCTSIVSAVIPDSVTTIGSSAFQSCSNLKNVVFPKNQSGNFKLNYYSFAFSGIENVDLSNTNMESVAQQAFYSCKKLETVKLNNVKTIERSAFSQCSALTSLIHSGELTTIEERSFENCQKLTVLKGKDSKHNLDTVLLFYSHSFYGSGIRDIVFNKNLKAAHGAFEGCLNLGTVDFSKVSSNFANFSRSKIEKLIFPSSLTAIPNNNFYNATLGSIVLPDTITEIGSGAFSSAKIQKITFGSGLKSIGAEAFKNAKATYDFSKVTKELSIGYEAFANNNFTSFTFPKSTVSIGVAALMGCNQLETLSIPFIAENSNSRVVSTDCFAWLFGSSIDCWDQDTVVPTSLKTVILHGENPGSRDFLSVGITNLVIGKDITAIGSENFGEDSNLQRVYYEGTEQEWDKINQSASRNSKLLAAQKYFYSDTKPTVSGNYWHYNANGSIEIW